MLNIVLFGPPGAGKGTQSQKLIDKYDLVHLSTGDMLRSEIANGSEIGMEAKKLMDQGILVPDDVVIKMISNRIDRFSYANGFIFDGFPRTAAQAHALDMLLETKNSAITIMLSLEVDNDELTRRIIQRGHDSNRPDDQDEIIVRNRINEYNTKTAPLKDFYSAQHKYNSIHGIGSVDSIFLALCAAIETVYKPTKKVVSAIVEKIRAATPVKALAQKAPAKKKPAKKKPAKKAAKKKVAKKKPAKKKVAKKSKKKTSAKKRPSKKKVAKKKSNKKAPKKKSGKKKASKKKSSKR